LRDGIVLCRVSSWITGKRLVSLPFVDHCEPLVNKPGDVLEMTRWLRAECDQQQYAYVELRPLSSAADRYPGLYPSSSFYFHELDLKPSLEQLFQALHKDSVQRKVRRAEREKVSYKVGRSQQLIDDFYELLLITRRRHQLPPQPRRWFSNLVECMGDKVELKLATKNETPIAAILTLRHGSSVIYKYGCSDHRFHHLGGMPFLFWRLIQESKEAGMERIDFGRTDIDNGGLSTFKDRFGAHRRSLTYYRYSTVRPARKKSGQSTKLFRKLVSLMPDAVLRSAGSILYKHMG
jgi:CelD/BcsL family acetyltransferase involved in cellulose biosynthesis